ncbi:MAG: hypothetical protein QOJ11_2079 [Frankiales bacterium]|jgi:hypothetical protein|nr:hypothetical protein [Frankiales bacterium]
MVDQLMSGPPEEQRRWPTPLIVILMVVVLVVALVHQMTAGGRPTARPTASPTVSRTPPTLPPDPLPSAPVEVIGTGAGEPSLHPRLTGVPYTASARVPLVLGGPQLVALGGARVPAGPVPVRDGESIGRVLAVPSGFVVSVNPAQFVDGQPSSKVYFVPRTGAARLLVATDWVFAAADGRSIFAERFGQSAGGTNEVLQVSLSGKVLARHRVPSGWSLQADSVAGLLVVDMKSDGRHSTVKTVDRKTFAVLRQLGKNGWIVGSTATRAAWTDAQCDSGCHLVITDLRSGRRSTLPTEDGFGISVVAFSPDGKRVAIAYYGRHVQQAGGSAAGFVDVVDLASHVRHRVPGVATDVKQAADLAWTPDGRWLAIAVGITAQGVRLVGLWPAAGGAVRVLPTRVPGAYTNGSLVAL